MFSDDGLPPLVRDQTNGGFIHAPSADHATTAAVLRNGFLTHATPAEPDTMSVNLTSARVRAAERVLDGVTRGQRLNELLGYQFERGLHDNHELGGPEVERFMLALRNKFPLVANNLTFAALYDTSISNIEARNVLDGVKLVEHVRKTNNPSYPFGFDTGTGEGELPAASTSEAHAINREAARLADTNDAGWPT